MKASLLKNTTLESTENLEINLRCVHGTCVSTEVCNENSMQKWTFDKLERKIEIELCNSSIEGEH